MRSELMRAGTGLMVFTIVLGASYGFVQTLLPREAKIEAVPRSEAERQRRLAFQNEIHELYEEFNQRRGTYAATGSADLHRWSQYTFRPRVNDLRQRLIQADMSGQAYDALLAAADRLAALAANPESRRARDAARRALRTADTLVESQTAP